MNLNQYDTVKKSNEGVFLHLVAPNGAKIYDKDEQGNQDLTKPVGLYLLGRDSKVYIESTHKKTNERLSNVIQTGTKPTSESMDEENISLLADLTVGWENLEEGGNKNFSRESVVKIYTKYPWAREQADVFIGTRANFI